MLQSLVSFISDYNEPGSTYTAWDGYGYAIGMALLMTATAFLHHQYFFFCFITGFRAKIAVTSMLYKRTLSFTASDLTKFSSGFATNVIQNDPNRFEICGGFLIFLFNAPVEGAVGLYLVYREIGVSMFLGLGVLVAIFALQFYSLSAFGRIRSAIVTYTDERIKTVNQVLVVRQHTKTHHLYFF
jgi:hypothetical protein